MAFTHINTQRLLFTLGNPKHRHEQPKNTLGGKSTGPCRAIAISQKRTIWKAIAAIVFEKDKHTHTQTRSIPISGCTLKTLSVNKRHILHVDLTKAKSDSRRSKLPQQVNQKTHHHHHQHLFISVPLPQNGSEKNIRRHLCGRLPVASQHRGT